MTQLNARLRRVQIFIQRFVLENGFAPTLVEIGAGCGFSARSNGNRAVSDLCALGYLERTGQLHRSIRIVRTIPDDHLEEVARAVVAALGLEGEAPMRAAHAAILSMIVQDERQAA